MKNLIATLLVVFTLLACSDDSGGSSDVSGSTMNPGGKYNGNWLLYSSHNYEYNEITYTNPPAEKFFDIDSGTEVMSDTAVILVLKGDSAFIYQYEGGESYTIELAVLDDLDEYDTTDRYDSLKVELVSRLMTESVSLSAYSAEVLNNISQSTDSLKATFGYLVSANYSAETGNGAVSGRIENSGASIYSFTEYMGALPPLSWPKEHVIEVN